jgi:hypothetical protein
VYTFKNNGNATLVITEAVSQITGSEPTDLISFVVPMQLEAGESTIVSQTQLVDYCQTNAVTTTIMARANPGQCEAEDTTAFTPT